MPPNTTPRLDTASTTHGPNPLTDLTKHAKYPPAARTRELQNLVSKFSGNAIQVFTHYTTPILDTRRKALLASSTTKKKFYKTASQLWMVVDDEQKAFWHHQAKLIRLRLKNATLGVEECVADAGLRSEWRECVRFAERAVAGHLGIAVPKEEVEELERVEKVDGATGASMLSPQPTVEMGKAPETLSVAFYADQTPASELLDTPRTPFTVEPCMIYGNFAQLYPYTLIRQAIGKHQTALLRQLADLLDPTGRGFFYCYATPHLWNSIRPTDVDQTIASVAHEIWMFLAGDTKREWEVASARTKKLLGNGDLEGLERLELERDCEEVWELHEMVKRALQMHMKR